jgi:hypothetical protein
MAASEQHVEKHSWDSPVSPQELTFRSFMKLDLRELCDRLLQDDSKAVEVCVAFLEAETRGTWHGRARAMMARRLKHCGLTRGQKERVISAVLDRLASGRFSENFKDQLRLVLHLDPTRAFDVAFRSLESQAEHVRRYAGWILAHEAERAQEATRRGRKPR